MELRVLSFGFFVLVTMICMFLAFVVVMIVFVMLVMVFVMLVTQKFDIGGNHGTTGGLWEHEKLKRPGKVGNSSVHCCAILVTGGGILKPNDIRTGRFEFHCNPIPFKSDVQVARAMLMGSKLSGFAFGKPNNREEDQKGRGGTQ